MFLLLRRSWGFVLALFWLGLASWAVLRFRTFMLLRRSWGFVLAPFWLGLFLLARGVAFWLGFDLAWRGSRFLSLLVSFVFSLVFSLVLVELSRPRVPIISL